MDRGSMITGGALPAAASPSPRPARASRAESMAGVSVRTERARDTFVERMLSLMVDACVAKLCRGK